MNPKVYEEFNKWYDKQEGKTFNFKEEVDKYCCSDVKVLSMGVLKFRQMFYEPFDVDPFRYIPISPLCLNLYLHKFMPLNTIVSNGATKPISEVSMQFFSSENKTTCGIFLPRVERVVAFATKPEEKTSDAGLLCSLFKVSSSLKIASDEPEIFLVPPAPAPILNKDSFIAFRIFLFCPSPK